MRWLTGPCDERRPGSQGARRPARRSRNASTHWSTGSIGPAIQFLVRQRDWVFHRLQVGGDVRMGHRVAYVGFDAFRPVMTMLDRPRAWHQEMEGDEGAGSGLPCAQGVELQTLLTIAIQYAFDRPEVFLRNGDIHQARGGALQ